MRHWQNEFATANALVGRQMGEMVTMWTEYNIPHSVMLVNIKILQRLVEETLKNVTPPEQMKYFERSMKEIDLLVDIAVSYGQEKNKEMWKSLVDRKKADFDPMCR
jgi:hypothetical protein